MIKSDKILAKTNHLKKLTKSYGNGLLCFFLTIFLFTPVPIQADTQTITLKKGWNLISTPLEETRPIAELFNGIAHSLWSYTSLGGWQHYDLTTANGTLTSIPPHQGIWIDAITGMQIELTGPVAPIRYAHLNAGWNLIGSGNSRSPDQLKTILAQKLNSAITTLFAFDPEVGWSFFDFARNLGTLTTFSANQGLWINLTPPNQRTINRTQPTHVWIFTPKTRPTDISTAVEVFAPGAQESTSSTTTNPDYLVLMGEPLQFTPFGLKDDGSLHYHWLFSGDIPETTEKSPSNLLFTTAGTHTVTLTITASDGSLLATESRTIQVLPQDQLPTGSTAINAITVLIQSVVINSITQVEIYAPNTRPFNMPQAVELFAPGGLRPAGLAPSTELFAPGTRASELPPSLQVTAP